MHISLDVDANITIMILLDYYQALRNSTDRLNKGGGELLSRVRELERESESNYVRCANNFASAITCARL